MNFNITRRKFLAGSLACAGTLITPHLARALLPPPKSDGCKRVITMHHIHTDETFELPYWKDGQYSKQVLAQINHFMRDWRQSQECPMNPQLLDMMHKLAVDVGNTDGRFDIICGFRSPKTNATLRQSNRGVAKSSLHMKGNAIDLNLKGTKLAELKEAARAMKMGGVGYYPKSNFIHIDIRDKPAYWG